MSDKRCPDCGRVKLESEWSHGASYCRPCLNIRSRRYYLKHKDEHASYARQYRSEHYDEILIKNKERYLKNKDRYLEAGKRWRVENRAHVKVANRNKHLRRKYGLGLSGFNELLAKQGGLCDICRTTRTGPHGVFEVDHDHKTGRVRGLLCHRCNSGLPYIEDHNYMELAIEYLAKQGLGPTND